MSDQENSIVLFQEKQIRRTWHNEEWWFAVVDVLAALTESKNPAVYWRVLKKRLIDEGAEQTVTNCNGFKLLARDGKMRKTDCANTAGMLRIIQSVPSKRAEPFKQWMAKVGYERIQEIENPELAAERARQYYRELGYDEDWIEKRLQSIIIRGQLTDEWHARGVNEGLEYAILTAEISEATFGLKPKDHKEVKDLKRENLRDHMTPLELIFTMLGDESAKQHSIKDDAQGFQENKTSAQKGGKAAGEALKAYEKETGDKVVSPSNYKQQIKEAKAKKKLKGKKDK